MMTEKQRMLAQMLYDASDRELADERIRCKTLCQQYNAMPIADLEGRRAAIKRILGRTGEFVHIEPDFWCDYGYNITVGEDFYANHGLVILDPAPVVFGDNVFIAPCCGFHTAGHPIDRERRNAGLEYAYPITVGSDVWFGACVHVMPGVTIGDDVVIGGGSVVVRDIPSGCLAVGSPCVPIRPITEADRHRCWDRPPRR